MDVHLPYAIREDSDNTDKRFAFFGNGAIRLIGLSEWSMLKGMGVHVGPELSAPETELCATVSKFVFGKG